MSVFTAALCAAHGRVPAAGRGSLLRGEGLLESDAILGTFVLLFVPTYTFEAFLARKRIICIKTQELNVR